MRVIDYGRYMPYERPYYVITICIYRPIMIESYCVESE